MTTQNIHADRILILDFGSQYTQLIARRVREAGVYSELYGWDVDAGVIRNFKPKGIILSGGPETVTADESPFANPLVFELGVPVLGICYGMQTMAAQRGGKVENADKHEYGYAQLRATLAPTRADRGSIWANDLSFASGRAGYAVLESPGEGRSLGTSAPPGPEGSAVVEAPDLPCPLAAVRSEPWMPTGR